MAATFTGDQGKGLKTICWTVLALGACLSFVPIFGVIMWIAGWPLIIFTSVVGWRIVKAGDKKSGTQILIASLIIAPLIFMSAPSFATGFAGGFAAGMRGAAPIVVSKRFSWWRGLYVVVTNTSNDSLVPTSAKLIRPSGKIFSFELPDTIPPNGKAEVRVANIIPFSEVWNNGIIAKGDVLELRFERYGSHPNRITFQ